MGAGLRNGLIYGVLYGMLWLGMHLLGVDSKDQTLGLVTFTLGWFAGLLTGFNS